MYIGLYNTPTWASSEEIEDLRDPHIPAQELIEQQDDDLHSPYIFDIKMYRLAKKLQMDVLVEAALESSQEHYWPDIRSIDTYSPAVEFLLASDDPEQCFFDHLLRKACVNPQMFAGSDKFIKLLQTHPDFLRRFIIFLAGLELSAREHAGIEHNMD